MTGNDMAGNRLDYFQKRLKENQEFLTRFPEMEITKTLAIYQEMTRDVIEEMREIPENERDYDISMLLVKTHIAAGETKQALALLDASAEDGKEDPLWYYYRGICLDSNTTISKTKAALAYYAQFLEMAKEKTLSEEDRALIGNLKTKINILKNPASLYRDSAKRLDLDALIEKLRAVDKKDSQEKNGETCKPLEYFQKKFKENQDFAAGNPEMELYEKQERHQKMTKALIKEIQEVPENKRAYDLSLLLVKICIMAHDAEEAFTVLWNNTKSGQHDPLWYYYVGQWMENYPRSPRPDLAIAYYTRFLAMAKEKPLKEEDRALTGKTRATLKALKTVMGNEKYTQFKALVEKAKDNE